MNENRLRTCQRTPERFYLTQCFGCVFSAFMYRCSESITHYGVKHTQQCVKHLEAEMMVGTLNQHANIDNLKTKQSN